MGENSSKTVLIPSSMRRLYESSCSRTRLGVSVMFVVNFPKYFLGRAVLLMGITCLAAHKLQQDKVDLGSSPVVTYTLFYKVGWAVVGVKPLNRVLKSLFVIQPHPRLARTQSHKKMQSILQDRAVCVNL